MEISIFAMFFHSNLYKRTNNIGTLGVFLCVFLGVNNCIYFVQNNNISCVTGYIWVSLSLGTRKDLVDPFMQTHTYSHCSSNLCHSASNQISQCKYPIGFWWVIIWHEMDMPLTCIKINSFALMDQRFVEMVCNKSIRRKIIIH